MTSLSVANQVDIHVRESPIDHYLSRFEWCCVVGIGVLCCVFESDDGYGNEQSA